MRLVAQRRCVTALLPAERWAARLRGRQYFTWLRAWLALARPLGGHGRVRVVTGGQLFTPSGCPDELLHVVMPGQPALAEYITWRAGRPHRPTIVDVTADVLGLLDDTPEAMTRAWDDPEHGTSADAAMFWSRPETLGALRRSLLAADVITTPWEALVAPLAELAGRPCVRVPDWTPGDRGRAFHAGLAAAYSRLVR